MTTLADYASLLLPRRRAVWSIGIYAGSSPFALAPHKDLGDRPVLDRHSLGSVVADGVADPFMVRNETGWLMFFEVENRRSGKGEIGLARSTDALRWSFEGIVLEEPFHLSYPHVFQHEGRWYMLPESAAAGEVRLYAADSFPGKWVLHSILIRGKLVDATPFRHEGRWWIFALDGFRERDAMVIYHADRLDGEWHAHARNPILLGNRRTTRPAGRMLKLDGGIVRFTQDYDTHYGRLVRAFRIEELTGERYREEPAGSEILHPSGRGWNATGMHHLDAHEIGPGNWIACVDGRRTATHLPLLEQLARRRKRNPSS